MNQDDPSSNDSSSNNDPATIDSHVVANSTTTGHKSVPLVRNAPVSTWGILRQLGPGLIVAGSIVGSGELIATTATGAKAGFWLLWLIVIGCIIKVFVQVEFGRYTIVTGKTTMAGLAEVPGPRIRGRGNWLIWYWFLMFVASIAQLGGIVGGVGQAMSISAPITRYGRIYNDYAEAETARIVKRVQLERQLQSSVGDNEMAAKYVEESLKTYRVAWQARGQLDSMSQDQWSVFNSPQPTANQLAESSPDTVMWLELLNEAEANQQKSVIALLLDSLYLKQSLPAAEESDQQGTAEAGEDAASVQRKDLETKIAQSYEQLGSSRQEASALTAAFESLTVSRPSEPIDSRLWASFVAILTAIILYFGRFGLIQSFSTAMVASFTGITIVNLLLLQIDPTWSISIGDIIDGLRFRLPPTEGSDRAAAISTALQTFGIIGVGATELVAYPYWCLEKGYASYVGPRDDSDEWATRASGWMKVLQWDAWGSLFVYTFATVAFYFLGAAILGRVGLEPSGSEMIRYLAVMYEPVFGTVAQALFLFGAIAVLYSTYFVANASHARTFGDAVRVLGVVPQTDEAYEQRVKWLSFLFPLLCLVIYIAFPKPTQLVLFSGLMQALMLPMLAAAALYFRYQRCDPRLQPKGVWDFFLWLSAVGMLIAGAWAAQSKIVELLLQ